MKLLGKILSVSFDIILVLFSLLNFITGDASFFDYFILLGELFIVVPATLHYHSRKKESQGTKNTRDLTKGN